jgi:hypothetical protein
MDEPAWRFFVECWRRETASPSSGASCREESSREEPPPEAPSRWRRLVTSLCAMVGKPR